MKKLFTIFALLLLFQTTNAQKKKVVVQKKQSTIKKAVKTSSNSRSFSNAVSVAGVVDLAADQSYYESVRSLLEDYSVSMIYSDHRFYGKESLKRGDFVYHFNSALESIKKFMDVVKQDTSLINTYDRNRSYITSAGEVKDVKPGNIYYNAVQSMIEKWGIAAMFTKEKKLNANSIITEADVYDILHVTIGYTNPAIFKRVVAIKRDAFAVMLSEAITQIRQRITHLPVRTPDVVRDTLYIQQPYDPTKKL